MIVNLSHQHSLLSIWLSEIRDEVIQKDRHRFRMNLERIGEVAAYEISKRLKYHEKTIQTPLGMHAGTTLDAQPVIATILRAGIPLQQGMIRFFDQADAAFIAAYRKYHRDGSFEIIQNYVTAPDISDRVLIICDPMLATGASMGLSIETLTRVNKPREIHVVAAIACTIGIDYLLRKFPDIHIWAGDIDEELTARGFIVPGLGDAGDLSYGDKQQS